MKWMLALCVVASAVGATTDMPDCTYNDYMSWSVVNGNRYMTVVYTTSHGSIITVTVCDHSLGSLEFTDALNNTMCNYWSSDHNGWNLTTSGTNGCVRTVTKDFDSDEYSTHCATSAAKTETGYQINTAVKEITDEMYSNTNIDGTISTTVLYGIFNDVMLIPTINDYDPSWGAWVSGYCGVMYGAVSCDIKASVTAPFYVTSINPKPLSFPTSYVNAAVVLTTDIDTALHSYSSATGTMTIYPKFDCMVYGTFTVQFLVGCLDGDPTCNAYVLSEFSSFNATITIGIPDCSETTQEAYITMRTYNEDGEFDAYFGSGTTITIEEIIATTGGTPGENCDCVTDMFIYDWSGNLLGSYIDMESLDIFDTESLVVTPLENEFSAYLDPSIFPDPNGEVVQLAATCTINWGFKKETVSFGRKCKILRDQPGSAEGIAALTVGVAEQDGGVTDGGATLRSGMDSTAPRDPDTLTHSGSSILVVSRVVWDHVVGPLVLRPCVDRGAPLAVRECTWLLGLADALFPLVPRACRAVLAAEVPLDEEYEFNRTQEVSRHWVRHTSRYFGLKLAAAAGSTRCIEWIARHGSRGGVAIGEGEGEGEGDPAKSRNMRKECVTVLRGLCAGCHLKMAQELVESSRDRPWRGGSLWWPMGDPDLMDDIREMNDIIDNSKSLLFDACRGGSLETVKWVMSTFGVGKEDWETVWPFQSALRGGNIEVVTWLASTTNVVSRCNEWMVPANSEPRNSPSCYLYTCLLSSSLEVMKLCSGWFCQPNCGNSVFAIDDKYDCLEEYLDRGPQSVDFEECCLWLKTLFSVEKCPKLPLDNGKSLLWLLNNFSLKPRKIKEILDPACLFAEEQTVLYMLSTFPSLSPVSSKTFIRACKNTADNVSLVKRLFATSPLLTKEDHYKCFVRSLAKNNISITEWLEDKFHVMEGLNSIPITGTFLEVCKRNHGLSGVQWFLAHTPVCRISETDVTQAILHSLDYGNIGLSLFLLRTFNVSIAGLKPSVVQSVVSYADISQVKQIVSHINISSSDIADGLQQAVLQSGKVVKWLILQFDLSEEQVKRDNNHLLSHLLKSNKKSCAEWFIHKFHVTFPEVIEMHHKWKLPTGLNARTWKMIMQLFPEITATSVKEHFMTEVWQSPLHMEITMKQVGLTKAEIDAIPQGPFVYYDW
ncbi:hypothetical protein Pelo_13376 [Pelomyxa schiedti]|nr:hypothetical protein Pelo_13376 [Pelomyxa schiedti]